jgi:hypothetical protein
MTHAVPEPVPPELQDELVAYLDGELAPEASRRMDELLASDPRIQAEVHRLQTAWELLDELPRTEVDEVFTRSTVTMVAQAVSEEIEAAALGRPQRDRRRRLAMGAGFAAACLAGFLAVGLLAPDANKELLRDLRVYQDLDPYRQAGDVEFLRQLKNDDVFPPEVATLGLTGSGAASADSLDERRRQIAAMPAEKHAELARQEARFAAFDADEQDRLRRFDAELSADRDEAELRGVMRAYHEWLKTLEPAEREELRRLSTGERVAGVKELHQKQAERAARRLDPPDLEVFAAWFEEHVRGQATNEQLRRWAKIPAGSRGGWVVWEMWGKMHGDRPRTRPSLDLTEEQIASLRERLSAQAQKRLDALATHVERQELIGGWVRQMLREQWSRGGRARPNVSQADLQHFFESKLTPDEQHELLVLPDEERERILLLRYHQAQELDRAWRDLESMLPEAPEPSS